MKTSKETLIEFVTFWDTTAFCTKTQMLHDLANGDGYVALKWADDREGWRQIKDVKKPAVQQKTRDGMAPVSAMSQLTILILLMAIGLFLSQ